MSVFTGIKIMEKEYGFLLSKEKRNRTERLESGNSFVNSLHYKLQDSVIFKILCLMTVFF